MNTRAAGLALSMVGLFLLSFFLFYNPKEVVSLDKSDFHKLVSLQGIVEKERVSNGQHYINMGDISVRCSCGESSLEGKKIELEGFVDEYNGQMYVRALKIFVAE